MSVTYHDAIHAQPENLRGSRAAVQDELSRLDLARWRGGTIGLIGMGASHNALIGALPGLRARGTSAHVFSASEFCDEKLERYVDGLIAVSQSGRSTETLAALEAGAGLPRLALTGDASAAIARRSEAHVSLALMEDSPIYTLGFTGTLQALGLLTAALTDDGLGSSWSQIPDAVERVLTDAAGFARRAAAALAEVSAVDVVSGGAHLAAAGETVLLLREACRLPAAVYETRQYLHGPMEPLQPGMALIAVGDKREVDLAIQAAGIGATALLLTTLDVAPRPGLHVYRLPALTGLELATLEIVPAQLLVGALATARGLSITGFRYEQRDTKVQELTR